MGETFVCSHCGQTLPISVRDEFDGRVLCESCYHDHGERQVIQSYYYKPEPIFYGEGNRFFGVELEMDEGGERDSKARQILAIANGNGLEHAYSNDFRCYTPPGDIPFRLIGVTDPPFTLNPLAGAETQGGGVCAQRLLSSLHGIFRMGPRANLALQKAALEYLEDGSHPTLRGLADFVHSQPMTSRCGPCWWS